MIEIDPARPIDGLPWPASPEGRAERTTAIARVLAWLGRCRRWPGGGIDAAALTDRQLADIGLTRWQVDDGPGRRGRTVASPNTAPPRRW